MNANKVTKSQSGIEGEYVYRGITICRDDSRKGYTGHWSAGLDIKNKVSTDTRTKLLSAIDSYIAKAA